MIWILHGSDYTKSRQFILTQQKRLSAEYKVELNLTDVTPKEVLEAVSSFDLFGKPPFVVLNLNDFKQPEFEKYVAVLKKIPDAATVFILTNKELGEKGEILKNADKIRARIVRNAEAPSSDIFRFINYLYSKNRTAAHRELNKLLASTDYFYIFPMIMYGLRNIVKAKFNADSFLKQKDFVKEKTLKQAENFSEKNLLYLFEFLYDIDKRIKTGQLSPEVALTYTIEKVIFLDGK